MNNIPYHQERIQQGQIQDFGKAAGGGGGIRITVIVLSTKTWCICAHTLNVFFPLFEGGGVLTP